MQLRHGPPPLRPTPHDATLFLSRRRFDVCRRAVADAQGARRTARTKRPFPAAAHVAPRPNGLTWLTVCVENAQNLLANSKALDGGPALYYIDAAAAGSADADKWVVFLQGGSICQHHSDVSRQPAGSRHQVDLAAPPSLPGRSAVPTLLCSPPHPPSDPRFAAACARSASAGSSAASAPPRRGRI